MTIDISDPNCDIERLFYIFRRWHRNYIRRFPHTYPRHTWHGQLPQWFSYHCIEYWCWWHLNRRQNANYNELSHVVQSLVTLWDIAGLTVKPVETRDEPGTYRKFKCD